jgi:lysophospholipase L1-like esterase
MTTASVLLLAALPALAAGPRPDPAAPEAKLDNSGWVQRHADLRARAAQGGVDVLFLGDSITQYWNDNEIWRARYAPLNAANFGIAGDKTQNVLWRIADGELDGLSPKVVVLLLGTNNLGIDGATAEEIARGDAAVLAALRAKLPRARILLLGIFPRAEKPSDPARAVIRDANARLARLAKGEPVRFLDFGEKLLESDGSLSADVMPDFLHPSLAGYRIWADAMDPVLAAMLAAPARP